MSDDATCASARRWLSADRDGEAFPDPSARAHLDGCGSCRAWEHALDDVTRRLVVHPAGSPDTLGPALASWQDTSAESSDPELRVARGVLALAGVLGILLAATAAFMPAPFGAGAHFGRDLVTFEAALSCGFLLAAWQPQRYGSSLLPVAGIAGVGTLLLSAGDLTTASVGLLAEASHVPVLFGLAGLFLLFDAANRSGRRWTT
jgi:predicted anti-sigma-YlaC factor YlaD